MTRKMVSIALVACASVLCAQQAAKPTDSRATAGQAATPNYDPGKVAAQISGSFYHPDDLTSLDCDLAIDWAELFSQMKADVPDARMKTLQGLKVRIHAVRGQTPGLKFNWASGVPDTQQQLTDGLKQMVSGYFQMYWPMLASPLFGSDADVNKVEPLSDGSAIVYSQDHGISVVTTIDKNFTPISYKVEGPSLSATIEPSYLSSPHPASGDLRRVSSMRVTQQIGDSKMRINLGLDYDDVGAFHIPKHVKFSLVGAYSLTMDFSGCSANQPPADSQ
jgi:hypothetical protein